MLRRLASKLKTAQVSRERALQTKENAIIQAQSKDYTSTMDARMERDRLAAIAAEQQHQWDRRMQNMQARSVLEVRITCTVGLLMSTSSME